MWGVVALVGRPQGGRRRNVYVLWRMMVPRARAAVMVVFAAERGVPKCDCGLA